MGEGGTEPFTAALDGSPHPWFIPAVVKAWWCAALTTGLVMVPGVTLAEESLPDMLRRVAPSVVQVVVDEEAVGSGFVYPTPRHVTTAYTAVNHDGEVWVVLTGGVRARARVVAWSRTDDIALLEVPQALPVAPLELEPAAGFAGQPIVMLGRPTPADGQKPEKPVARDLPTPRFGFVSLVSGAQVNVDVQSCTRGDHGAPILTTNGRVLGVVSGKVDERLGSVDAATAAAVRVVQQQSGKQGEFEAHEPAEKGPFAGVYMSPWQAYHQVGAGMITGYKYRWLSLTIAATFSHASFAPIAPDRQRARYTVASEVYGTVDWRYAKGRKLIFGAGFAVTLTSFNVRENGREVDLDAKDRVDASVDPLLVLQDVEGPVMFGLGWAPTAEAARLDIGLILGR